MSVACNARQASKVSKFQSLGPASNRDSLLWTARNRPSFRYLGWSRPHIRDKPIASLREVSMQRVIQSVLAAAVLLGMAATARAESVMKQCGEQWQAAKAAGTTSGATWPQFLAQCRTQLGSGAATAGPMPAPAQPQTGSLFPWQAPAAPAPAPTTSTAIGNQSVMKQCGAQWQTAFGHGGDQVAVQHEAGPARTS